MAYAPYEALWIIKESAYGTKKGSLVAGTDTIYIRLDGPNRFTMRPMPLKKKIPFGGGFDAAGYAVSDKIEVKGNLSLELCYSQATLLGGWAFTRVNSAQTSPWTTTEPAGDMISCTIYHAIMREDGTFKRRKYKGCKVHKATITSKPGDTTVMLNLELQAQKADGNSYDSSSDPDSTEFPLPADTAFPTDPLMHSHLTATVNSSSLTYCQGVTITVTPVQDARFFTNHFIAFDRTRGRRATADLDLLYTASPNWRSVMESLTSYAASFAWGNGSNTVTLSMKDSNLVDNVGDDLTPGTVYNQAVTLENQWDTGNSADVTFTYA